MIEYLIEANKIIVNFHGKIIKYEFEQLINISDHDRIKSFISDSERELIEKKLLTN